MFGQTLLLSHGMPFPAELPQDRRAGILVPAAEVALPPTSWHGPLQGGQDPLWVLLMAFPSLQELDSVILVGLLQLSLFCDSQSTCLPRHDHLSMPWE